MEHHGTKDILENHFGKRWLKVLNHHGLLFRKSKGLESSKKDLLWLVFLCFPFDCNIDFRCIPCISRALGVAFPNDAYQMHVNACQTYIKRCIYPYLSGSIRIYPNLPGSSKRSEGESFVSWFSSCSNESSEKMSNWNRLWNRLKSRFSTSPTQIAHIVACKYGVSWSWMICIDSSCLHIYICWQANLWYPTLRILSVHIRHVQCHALRPVTFIHFIHVIHSLFILFILFVPWRLLAHAAVFLLCL